MNYPSVRIEGAILSPDLLEHLEDRPGQKPADFGLDPTSKVKDEIARAWADAQDYWRIFQRKLETLKADSPATTETRQQWVGPLLGLLGYQLEYQARGTELDGKLYNISHRATNRSQAPVQIIGYHEPAGLDRKPERANRRMSAHAVVQEFLNLNEQLYGLATNGRVLRLLRDSSRLIKLSYLEFDLDRIFSDGLFADFAILYRLLHASRLPLAEESNAESWIERYHQDSLDSGARIREGLSLAVEQAIRDFGSGFLAHPKNDSLRKAIADGRLAPEDYYKDLLRLIYRLLFLMVIEERDLVFPTAAKPEHRAIYRDFYGVHRLRILSEKRYLADARRHDLWLALLATFRLFETDGPGSKLGLAPLAGDLFGVEAIGWLAECTLGNDVLLGCLRSLSLYEHPDSRQLIRVNYGALNVEEFGSVYEGLLEYEPILAMDGSGIRFDLQLGEERSATGSHYTPDDFVQPLVKHSLDYLIADRLKEKDQETALLSLRVADIACGSGHILLVAARRIATELAVVRTGEDQPSPTAFRAALRDVIRTCIYGVDLNPLAVELCKVALWLEAHNPGQPLNFLDHHIKCGNAIVGFARQEELGKGVPDEAFKTLPGDDKEVAAAWRKRNKLERQNRTQESLNFSPQLGGRLDSVLEEWKKISALPERTPTEIEKKKESFSTFGSGENLGALREIAAIPISQFYMAKTESTESELIGDAEFRQYWTGNSTLAGKVAAGALTTANQKRFFHWFLEFPEVMAGGGFDCILGNPPYLHGQKLSGTYGHAFCELARWIYAPVGLSDLVVFFVRRAFRLLQPAGFVALITTNSIIDGEIRKDGLEQILNDGAEINMAVRGRKWPGRANLVVSLLAVHHGSWGGPHVLDGLPASAINAFFEDGDEVIGPSALTENGGRVYQGSIFLGEGFLLSHDESARLISADAKSSEVLYPVINGKETNNNPDQRPSRMIINFKDMPLEGAKEYAAPFAVVEKLVKPDRQKSKRAVRREKWWQHAERAAGLYRGLRELDRCFAAAATTKHLSFSAQPTDHVFLNTLYVFTTNRWDLFTVVQSTLHEVWARKYSGSLKQDLRYSPSKCFDTFVFPDDLWNATDPRLAKIGERYHEHRKALMRDLWLGLTKTYNLFHDRDLSPEMVAKVSKKSEEEAARGYEGLLELRRLHVELDCAVRDAYDWQSLDLGHDFHEVDTLAENDRVRFTISSNARREVLKRLLALNHARAEKEPEEPEASPKKGKRKKKGDDQTGGLFG